MTTQTKTLVLPTKELSTLATIRQEVETMFLEREDVIYMSLLAMFAKQHAVLIGPPGTGKSALLRELCQRFCDAQGNGLRFFFYQLHQLTELDELFGPVSVPGMETGTYERAIENTMATAEVVLLDEIWKGSSTIHNATLRATNERKFKNGTKDIDMPLISIFGASNELPQDKEEMAAARDRYLFTAFVGRLSPDNFRLFMSRRMKLVPDPFDAPKTTLSKDEFHALQEFAEQIPFTQDVLDTWCTIREDLAKEKILISDRRAEWCTSIMKINAMFEQRGEVNRDDLDVLRPALWLEPNELKTVSGIVSRHSNPTNAQATTLKDNAQTVYEQAIAQMTQQKDNRSQRLIIASEAAAKLEISIQELQKLEAGNRGNKRVAQAVAQVTRQHQEMLESVGFKSRTN